MNCVFRKMKLEDKNTFKDNQNNINMYIFSHRSKFCLFVWCVGRAHFWSAWIFGLLHSNLVFCFVRAYENDTTVEFYIWVVHESMRAFITSKKQAGSAFECKAEFWTMKKKHFPPEIWIIRISFDPVSYDNLFINYI